MNPVPNLSYSKICEMADTHTLTADVVHDASVGNCAKIADLTQKGVKPQALTLYLTLLTAFLVLI